MFALFGVVSQTLFSRAPWGIKTWLETGVSAKRIEVVYMIFRHYIHHRHNAIYRIVEIMMLSVISIEVDVYVCMVRMCMHACMCVWIRMYNFM
jgi:hypothetical protein